MNIRFPFSGHLFSFSKAALTWCLLMLSLVAQAQVTQLTHFTNISVNQEYYGFAKMAPAPDGGYAVLQVHHLTGDIHVLRFEACGELQWSKLVTMDLLYRPTRSADIVFTPDGTLHAGVMHHGTPGYFTLLRFSTEGDLLVHHSWQYWRMGAGVFSMGVMPDGQLFITGLNHPPTGPVDFTALIDSSGTLSPVRGYLRSSAGYQTVGVATPEGHILVRRGDHFYMVDPYTGDVIWRRGLVAPLYNGVIPVKIEEGWLLLGQFSNSTFLYNALPVFVDNTGEVQYLGEMFPANGNTQGFSEYVQMRRVLPLSGNRFVTVTTDSFDLGYLAVVIFSDLGEVLEQRYINPDPDQYRFLNHDFAMLPNEVLAIAANLDGQLAIIHVPLGAANSCGTVTRKEVFPYTTTTSTYGHIFPFLMDTLGWEPFDIQATVNDFPLSPDILCEEVPFLWPDTFTVLTLCPDDAVLANATHSLATTYLWPDGDTSSQRYLVTEGEYEVKVQVGCLSYIHTFRVEASSPCDCSLRLPNLFTPNRDGTNDTFGPVDSCPFNNYNLTVYNRWGQLVFESSDPKKKWDGTFRGADQPSDTYVWHLEMRPEAGEDSIQIRGEIVLLR